MIEGGNSALGPPEGAINLRRATPWQPFLTVSASERTHADFHQAVIGQCGLCWAEQLLDEVVRS